MTYFGSKRSSKSCFLFRLYNNSHLLHRRSRKNFPKNDFRFLPFCSTNWQQRLWVALHRVEVRALSLQQLRRLRDQTVLLPMPSTTGKVFFLLRPLPFRFAAVVVWLGTVATSRRCPPLAVGSPFCYTTVLYRIFPLVSYRENYVSVCLKTAIDMGSYDAILDILGSPQKATRQTTRMCISAKLPSVLSIETERALFKKSQELI